MDFQAKQDRRKKFSKDKKNKYKNKSNQNKNVVENTETRCELPDNSSYYEISDEENEIADNSKDFSVLSEVPISQGHFQFKSDTFLGDANEVLVNNELFKLDLNLLNLSLNTIPFNERCGLSDEYFMHEELKFMKNRAENNMDQYLKYIKEKEETINTKENNFVKCVINKLKETNLNESELETVNSNVSTETSNSLPVNTLNETSDLPDWLDDLLDD